MIYSMFYGRISELERLKREYARSRSSLLVLYGRRRVGKSTLILQSLEGQRHVYFQATRLTASQNLVLFKQALLETFGASVVLESLSDWAGVLAYLPTLQNQQAQGLQSECVFVLDEFPYLAEAEPALPSLIQRAWDAWERAGHRIKLVLCGSSIAFMESLLAEKNPLYGRQTFTLDLAPLGFREVRQAFPNLAPDAFFTLYGIYGGMPYYLRLIDPQASLEQNLLDTVLEPSSPLFEEPLHLLQAEMREVGRYQSILAAVADGQSEFGEIVNRIPEFSSGNQLSPYTARLEGLRLLETVHSLDKDAKGRNRRHFLSDPFLRFWYRFVLPYSSALESGNAGLVYAQRILPQLNRFMGEAFEDQCREYVSKHALESLHEPALEVGRIWGGDFDLDVVARLLSGGILLGECKWWTERIGINVLETLQSRHSKTSYGKGEAVQYALFSRSGFTSDLERLVQNQAQDHPKVHLYSLERLLGEDPQS
jgi:uncharacterized protein